MKVLYAVAMNDLDVAWNSAAGTALLESLLNDDAEPRTVDAEPGVSANVLTGPKDIVEAVVRGLLDMDLPTQPPRRARIYAQGRSEKTWTRITTATDVPFVARTRAISTSPRIDKEISELSAPMDAATEAALRESLVAEGCREALVVWEEQDILLDGHHRLALCRELGIPHRMEKRSFPDRAAAMAWFLTAQRARRSLTPSWANYYLGRQYNAQNVGHGGARRSSGQNVHLKVGEKIACESGVGEKTVRRAAGFADALDTLERAVRGARRAILNREIRLSRRQIDHALDRGLRTLDDLRELAEPPERDDLADALSAARKLVDFLHVCRSRGVGEADRERLGSMDARSIEALEVLPALVAAFRASLHLSDGTADQALAEVSS